MGDDLLLVMTDIEKRGKDLLAKREKRLDWVEHLKNLSAWLKEYGEFENRQISEGEKAEGFERLVNVATKLDGIRNQLLMGLSEEGRSLLKSQMTKGLANWNYKYRELKKFHLEQGADPKIFGDLDAVATELKQFRDGLIKDWKTEKLSPSIESEVEQDSSEMSLPEIESEMEQDSSEMPLPEIESEMDEELMGSLESDKAECIKLLKEMQQKLEQWADLKGEGNYSLNGQLALMDVENFSIRQDSNKKGKILSPKDFYQRLLDLNKEMMSCREDMDYIIKIRDVIKILGVNRVSAFFRQELDSVERELVNDSSYNFRPRLQNINHLLVSKTPRDTIIDAIQVLQNKASHLKGPEGKNIREELKQISECVQKNEGAGEFLFNLAKINEVLSKAPAETAEMKNEKTPIPIFGKILDKIKKSEVNEKKTQTPRSPNPLMQRLRKHSPEVETPKNNPNIPGNSISQRKK